MSVDYAILQKSSIGLDINKVNIGFSFEGYRQNQANVFCKLMRLPEIPYSLCFLTKDDIIENCNFEENENKNIKRSEHWDKWGLDIMKKLKAEDVLNNSKVIRKDIYANKENIKELKEDIVMFLDIFEKNKILLSLV